VRAWRILEHTSYIGLASAMHERTLSQADDSQETDHTNGLTIFLRKKEESAITAIYDLYCMDTPPNPTYGTDEQFLCEKAL
jgi:hypothetical protein